MRDTDYPSELAAGCSDIAGADLERRTTVKENLSDSRQAWPKWGSRVAEVTLALLLSGCLVPTAAVAAPIPPVSVSVSAAQDAPGIDTGVTIAAGQLVIITAWGLATYGSDVTPCGDGFPATDPNGLRYLDGRVCRPKFDPSAQVPNAPIGMLLGRVGSGSWFPIGTHFAGRAGGTGRLFLLYNDDPGLYSDNAGSYHAVVWQFQR